MGAAFLGYNPNAAPQVSPLFPTVTIADGDWVFWFVYYTNDITVAIDSPTGWTQLRKTVGSIGTIELWRYHWNTGDPTSWTLTWGGGGGPASDADAITTVFRGVASTPTIVSTTHETTASPALVNSITNAAIGDNDLAVAFMAVHNGTADASGDPDVEGVINSGSSPGISEAWWRVGAGFAPSRSVAISGGTTTDTLSVQIILNDLPLGGWGVGQVRMDGASISSVSVEALVFTGSSGNYITTPDSAANSITGDLDIRIRLTTPATPPASPDYNWGLVSKMGTSGISKSFAFAMQNDSTLTLTVSTNGSNDFTVSSSAVTLPSSSPLWLRATRVAATGVCAFYTSTDGSSWTGIGGGTMTSGAIYDSTDPLEIGEVFGQGFLQGSIYQVELRDGIGGTVVQSFDATAVTKIGTRNPSTVSAGGPWTVIGSTWDWA